MKNLFTYLVLVLCIGIYVASSSEQMTRKVAAYKYKSTSLLRSDKYRYGDLFGMSFYPGFEVPVNNDPVNNRLDKCDTGKKAVDLYALCDSYVWGVVPADTFYCNVHTWVYATANKMNYLPVQFDTARIPILLIELSERNVRLMLQYHFDYLMAFADTGNKPNMPAALPETAAADTQFLFNKNINTNIEFNVFETALFTPVKKWKAALNQQLFNTMDTNVAIGPDKKYLLFKPTVHPTSLYSSFAPVSNTDIDTMVNRLNAVYSHYKKIGFKEVYFSMIPNPVTILYPDYNGYRHNQLISRIQNNPALHMPVIDMLADFKKAPFPIYHTSDSHWNMDGALIWVNKTNGILRRIKNN